ncbi:MAG TPA: SCO family protein [Polyangia bacterium]
MPLSAPVPTPPGPTEVAPGASAPTHAPTGPSGPRARRWFGSVWLWGLLALFGLMMPLATRVLRPAPEPLPVISELPSFSLTDQDGRPFGKAELAGKVWLAGFIFTRCPTICPALTATMARIQHRARGIEPQFRLVSISVDPTHDTPQRLTEFAAKHKASPRMWRFLTGPLDEVRTTVVDGLKIAMGDVAAVEGEQDFESIMHGTHFVLVDQQGRIRGYYPSTDADVVDRVLADAAMLINRGE